jgi:predicted  nucleic acid-binding Zn-ribbon protein
MLLLIRKKMNISFNLYQLQKIDSQIVECNQRLIAIEKEMEGSPELIQSRKESEESLIELNESKRELEKINNQVEIKKNKIEQSEASLYSGTEKNPKILQDLQTEIAMLKKQMLELNDALLEKMIICENLENQNNITNDRLHSEETKFNTSKALLTSERNSLEILKNRLGVERKANFEQIPKAYIMEYELLCKNKQGIAVATLQDNSCSVCGTTFTPSQCQESHSQAEIFHCPTCHRIVYGG